MDDDNDFTRLAELIRLCAGTLRCLAKDLVTKGRDNSPSSIADELEKLADATRELADCRI